MTRKLLPLLLIILLLTSSARAQFHKGMRMAGVSIGNTFFNAGKYEYSFPPNTTVPYTTKNNSLGVTLSPSLGWFVKDNIVVGGQLVLRYRYEKNLDIENNVTFRKKEDKNFYAGLGAFSRAYWGSFGGFNPFGQLNIDILSGSSSTNGFRYTLTDKETYSGKSSGDFSFGAGLSVGVTKMLGSHIGLDIQAGYAFSRNKNMFKTTTQKDIDTNGSIDETIISEPTTVYTNNGFVLSVGLQVFLGGKK